MSRFIYCYAECRYAECRFAECLYAECLYAECLYAECRFAERLYAECSYAECRGACNAALHLNVDNLHSGKLNRMEKPKRFLVGCYQKVSRPFLSALTKSSYF
jgi:hypothetical protein